MPPTRVLVVGPKPPPLGGIATYVQTLLSYRFSDRVAVSHLNTVKSANSSTKFSSLVLASVKNVLMVARAAVGYDVVHIHTASYRSFLEKSIMVLVVRLLIRRQVILHLHGAEFDRFYNQASKLQRSYIKLILSVASCTVALSKYWAEFLCHTVRVHRRKVVILPNGVIVPPQGMLTTNSRPIKVLLMAVLEERKGVHEFLDAVHTLRDQPGDVVFQLAGPVTSGALAEEQLMRKINELGLKERIQWLGPVTGAAKTRHLQEADIFVIPSHAEGLPIALLEAMAWGAAVIATPVGGIPEVLTHGENALIVPVRNASALASAIRSLIDSPTLRQWLARAARERVAAAYDFSRIGARVEDLYVEVAAK